MTGFKNRFKDESPEIKTKSKLDDGLDRSRKHALWRHSNWTATILIVFVVGIAYLNMCADVRGEYGGNNDGLGGMMICSITHADKTVAINMIIPNTPMMSCTTTEEEMGHETTLVLKPVRANTGAKNLTFQGKIDSNEVTGLIKDGMRLYQVNLHKDALASLIQQFRALIPGSNTPIDFDATTTNNR